MEIITFDDRTFNRSFDKFLITLKATGNNDDIEKTQSLKKLASIFVRELSNNFEYRSDWFELVDSDTFLITRCFTNTEMTEAIYSSDIPDDVVTFGIDLKHSSIDFMIGNTACHRVILLGPIAYDSRFNDDEFNVDECQLYRQILDMSSKAISRHLFITEHSSMDADSL